MLNCSQIRQGINSFLASINLCSLLMIAFANCLDPGWDLQNVGPDLPNSDSVLKTFNFEKKWTDDNNRGHEKLASEHAKSNVWYVFVMQWLVLLYWQKFLLIRHRNMGLA